MDSNTLETSTNFDQYHADIQSLIDAYVISTDNLSPSPSPRKYARRLIPKTSSSLITFDRDPAVSEDLTDDLRWLLIQYGPHQPRDDEEQFLASAKSTNNGKGNIRFRAKWFDDPRFSEWLEYSLSTCRAYCFYCRLFADSNRNRAFSRDGIANWRKCLGSRGQKKRRSTGILSKPDEDAAVVQRRGLLESHAMSESHKQAFLKYRTFIEQMHLQKQTKNEVKPAESFGYVDVNAVYRHGNTNLAENIKQEADM